MQSSPDLVWPCPLTMLRVRWGAPEASRANTTAHLLVLSLLLFSPSSTTLTILEQGLSPVTPHLEGSFPARPPPLCRQQVATSPALPSKPSAIWPNSLSGPSPLPPYLLLYRYCAWSIAASSLPWNAPLHPPTHPVPFPGKPSPSHQSANIPPPQLSSLLRRLPRWPRQSECLTALPFFPAYT